MTIQTRADLDTIIAEVGSALRFLTIADVYDDIEGTLGEDAGEYDIPAIADEAFDWYAAYDTERHVEWRCGQGFYQVVDAEGFWRIVARHSRR